MELIGAFEAKTHLSALLERVGQGERITITRHGIPIAMLVPVGENGKRLTHHEIIKSLKSLRKRVKPGKMTIREMIREGRRF